MSLFAENRLASKRYNHLIRQIKKNAEQYRDQHGLTEFAGWKRVKGIRIPISQPAIETVEARDANTTKLLRTWKTQKTMQRRKRYEIA
jgi:hypothetical protein